MTDNLDQPLNEQDRIVNYFLQHMIPAIFTFKKGDDERKFSITTFVVSIENDWFLVTAGHCLESIEYLVKKQDYKFVRCRLEDTNGINAKFQHPIPFDFLDAYQFYLKEPFDYGIIYLREHYRELLKTNHIKPLNEETWEKQPDNPDFFWLLGVPDELVQKQNRLFLTTSTFHPVKQLRERPPEFKETNAPVFYGEIILGHTLTDIKGMSGGPIFSFKEENGSLRYWLHAVQSGWIKSKRYISALLTSPFIAALKYDIEKNKPILK